MKQTEAVDVVYSLLPRMKAEDPAQVMSKYASARGLSAAQLERLGHVFNTASTLATLEKDRNGSPALVDVPQMVDGYVRTTGSRKRASFFDTEAAPEQPMAKAASQLPDVWVERQEALPDFEKQAKAVDRRPDQRRVLEQAVDLAERAVEEQATAMSKYAAAVYQTARTIAREEDPYIKFATLIADVQGLSSEAESQIYGDKLATELQGLGIDVRQNGRQAKPVVLSRDRTGLYDQVREGLNHLKVAVDNHACLLETVKVASDMMAELGDDWRAGNIAMKAAARIDLLAEAAGIVKEAAPDKKKEYGSDDYGRANRYADRAETILKSRENREIDKDTEEEKYRASDVYAPLLGAGFHGALGAARHGAQFYRENIPAYLKYMSPSGPVGQALEPWAEEAGNRAKSQGLQRRQMEQDAIAGAVFKKVYMTDEILSTKPYHQVLEAYQSLRRASPELSTDPSIVRLMLRTAMETQGLDIDSASAARKYQYANNPPKMV